MLRIVAMLVALGLAVAAVLVFRLPDERPPRIPRDTGLSGPEVAERFCQGCHRLPVPGQLPKEAWPFVIDWMGNYLGYEKLYEPFAHITGAHLIPPKPVVSKLEMDRLGRYLIDAAPWSRDFRIERAANPPLEGFEASTFGGAIPPGQVVALLHIDEQHGRLYAGTRGEPRLYVFDREGRLLLEQPLAADPIHIEMRAGGFRLTTMGDFDFDRQRSQVIDFELRESDSGVSVVRQRMLVNGFHRAPETRSADIDGDGREDLVVVGFGDGVGPGYGKVSIAWATEDFAARYEGAPARIDGPFLDGAFDEQVLHDRAGGLGARILDANGDGRLDVLVLATQGANELIAYLNEGNRHFRRHVLIEEHVSFGFNQFQTLDFDGDGHVDLVTVNGNNMEMPDPPLRPYHGLRIWLGDGALGFREAFFYPMYGAMTAVVRDLDGDGDPDLALNSFYPEWAAREPETFTLLENRGALRFEARTLSGEHWGRWLRIAAGDLDGDGDVDLALGAGNLPGGGLHPGRPRLYERYRRRLQGAPSLVVLERE